jgi:predicted small secreted protein
MDNYCFQPDCGSNYILIYDIILRQIKSGVSFMKKTVIYCMTLVMLSGLVTGCLTNPSGNDINSLDSTEIAQTANLEIILTPETISNLRAATTIYTARITVLVANPGSSSTLFHKLVKEIDISNNSAEASFAAVPARPVIVQVTLNNASISNARMFHAAKDLQPGQNNSLTPKAAGSGTATDIIAKVASEIFNSPELMSASSDDLIGVIEAATTGISDESQALSAAINSINPSGLVALSADTTPTTLKYGSSTITAEETWSSNELWTTTPANMTVAGIIRQGIGGYGIVYWSHARESDSAIAKTSTLNGKKTYYCRNYGKLKHFIAMSDGSIIAAGFNNKKNAPVVLRWDPTQNASTFSDSGLSDSGLKWTSYFSDLADDLSGYSIETILSDFDSTLFVTLKASDNSLIEYRLSLNTGERLFLPGSPEEGREKILSYHDVLQNILENNSLSETTRTAKFIFYVADDFKDIAGNPNKRDELESVTLSRLQRYTINSYTFEPVELTIVDANTIKVETRMQINVTLKPGATGAVKNANINVFPAPVLTWKRYNKEWKIYQGLPYKSSEIGI